MSSSRSEDEDEDEERRHRRRRRRSSPSSSPRRRRRGRRDDSDSDFSDDDDDVERQRRFRRRSRSMSSDGDIEERRRRDERDDRGRRHYPSRGRRRSRSRSYSRSRSWSPAHHHRAREGRGRYDELRERRRPPRGDDGRGWDHRREEYDESPLDNRARKQPPPFVQHEIRKGVVRSIQPYGLFVRLMMEDKDDAKDAKDDDDDRYYTRRLPDGLVHASQVSDDITFQRDDSDEAKVQSLSYFFPVDTKVFVKVLKCEEDPARGWKVSLSMKIVNQETGEDNDPENKKDVFNKSPNNAPSASFEADLFGVYKGKVSSIKPYGVFVNLENTRTSALVHVSEISEHLRFSRGDTDEDKVMGIEGVLSVGESCFVKIIEMKPPESERDRMKLSGSIRLVDQKSGEDLDPENMKLRERRDTGGGDDATGGRFNKKPVGADAGEKVQPGGIVQWGHEKADVKEQSKNAYDFVVDVEDDQKHQPRADDYSKPRFGHGLEGYVPEVKKEKKRKEDKKESKKSSRKRKKREKKEKKKRKSRKKDKKKKKSSRYSSSYSSSYTSSDSDDSYSSSY